MKKFLLSLSVALMATAMNAQTLMTAPSQSLKARDLQPKAMNLQMPNELKASIKDFSDLRAKLKKAPAQSDLYGDYIEDMVDDIHSCNASNLSSYVYTDDESGESYEYVEVVLDGGYADVIGIYDADASTLTIPGGTYCYEVTSSDALYSSTGACKFYLIGLAYDENGTLRADYYQSGTSYYYSDLVFDVDEDGILSLESDGYLIAIDGGDYDGYSFDGYHLGVSMFPSNATEDFGARYLGNDGWEAWEDVTDNAAAVEDYGESLNIYNMANSGSCISVNVNDDLTVSIDAGQPVYTVSDTYQEYGFGEYIMLMATVWDADSLAAGIPDFNIDETASVTGTLKGNTITLNGNDITIEDGDYVGNYGTYFYFCSQSPESGQYVGYRMYMGCIANYSITLNEGNFEADGIKEVNGTREDKIRNTKTYNLMGQQVNRDAAKGLLIRDGKKYIQK